MKTAISIPEPDFRAAEKLAKRLGMSRSELYQVAVAEFLARHTEKDVTEALNEIYAAEPEGTPVSKDVQWMVIRRGEIWWASLRPPTGSEPGFRRPVLIVQANAFNRSKIGTVIAAVVTSNLRLATAPGNVRLTKAQGGLRRDSVINMSQIVTLDKSFLTEPAGRISAAKQEEVDQGLQLVLGLVG